LDYQEAAFIGVFQSLVLLAGISRSGVSMVGALVRELDLRTPQRLPSCSPPR